MRPFRRHRFLRRSSALATLAIANIAAIAAIAASALAAPLAAESYTATAEFESERTLGTSRLAFTLVVDRTTDVAEARRLVGLLDSGGQGLLRSAVAGRSDGRIQLGGMEFAVNLVVATGDDDERVISVLTANPLRRARTPGDDDAAHPFGVLRLTVDSSGHGEGRFVAATALALDGTGALVLGEGTEPGRLLDVRRID